jgi:hypothetical protein
MVTPERTAPPMTALTGVDQLTIRHRLVAAIRDADARDQLGRIVHDNESIEVDIDRIVRSVLDTLDDAGVILARPVPPAAA